MQNTVGKLMGRIVGRKLARYLEEREVLPVNQEGSDQYNAHGKIQLHLHMTYTKDSRGKNKQWLWQSIQAAEGPARTIWSQPNTDPVGCRSAPGKNSVYAAWKLELCPSSAHFGRTTRITVLTDPLQCLYTKGLADLNQTGPSKILILTDDGLTYTTLKHSQEAAEAVQQHLDSVSKQCDDTGSLINPHKAQTLWCTLYNRAAGKPMPAVTFAGAVVERTSHLRYLGIHSNRMLTYSKHVETTALKCKKGLSVLKAMAAKGIEERTSSYSIKVWCSVSLTAD